MIIPQKTELGKYLDRVIETSVKQALYDKGLKEKEKQVSLAPANKGEPPKQHQGGDQPKKDDEPRDFDAMKDDEKSKTMQDDSDAMKGDVKLDDVIEKLNTIRSGKSFKDSLVQQRFDQYFNSLKPAEKTALFSLLKGIAGIVTGEVEADDAADPVKADITMHTGSDEDKQKHIKPNIIKSPTGTGTTKAKQGGGEDTSSPIQVKKR